MRLRRLLLGFAAASAAALSPAATPAHAEPLIAPGPPILDGLSGGISTQPFESQVGASPGVFGVFVRWGSLGNYVFDSAERAGARLMIHVSTSAGQNMPGVISPGEIARGQGDGYLLHMNRRLVGWGQPTYVRLLSEMNQVNNPYAGFNRDGSSRGRDHSPKTFQKMWRRSTLILRGGPVAAINEKLRSMGLPPVRGAAADAVLGTPQVAMMWVPQTRGTPDIPANMPRAYWPGPGYVDWVGTDFYSRFPRFDWLTQFYNSFRGKPFVFAEWAMWGDDSPGFVKQLFQWVRQRPRVKMMLYNQGKAHRGVFRLDNYPRARAELRRQLARG